MPDRNAAGHELADLPELLTVEEARAVLRMSRTTIYDLLRKGEIPAIKFGRNIRIRKASLIEESR